MMNLLAEILSKNSSGKMNLDTLPEEIDIRDASLPQIHLPSEGELYPSALSASKIMPHLQSLMQYVQNHHYEGWDPFDALNSKVFRMTPFYRSPLARLVWLQFFKRSSVNLRPFVFVPRSFNPKGGALFLMGYLNCLRYSGEESHANEAYILFQRLRRVSMKRPVGWAWGYDFDWQARAFYVPQGTPNMVTSVYAGHACLEYYRFFQDEKALQLATGVADFILNEMIQFEDPDRLCFRYIPSQETQIHNANLLGAAYLSRMLDYLPLDRQAETKQKILKAAHFSVADLQENGAWPYGTKPFHRWVDHFHTAYNIECLLDISTFLQTDCFHLELKMALDYYFASLFSDEGIPKAYNNRLYPIDIHAIAEAIVLINRIRQIDLSVDPLRLLQIETQLRELMRQFQDPQGFFYYQRLSNKWNHIPYMRWGQAWMFYALSTCL